jgi:hypothetical protein
MLSVPLLPSIGKQTTFDERKLYSGQRSTRRGVVGDDNRIQSGAQCQAVELNNRNLWCLSADE